MLLAVVTGLLGESVGLQQISPNQNLRVGVGVGQVGVIAAPNEQCRGPVTVAAADFGKLAILDDVNSKIVLLGGGEARDIALPSDLAELADIIVTDKGFVVVDALGKVVAVGRDGAVIAQSTAQVNPEAGTVRFTTGAENRLLIENIRGDRVPAGLTPQQVGVPIDSTGSIDFSGTYTMSGRNTGRVTLSSSAVSGQLSSITVSSPRRIQDARILSVQPTKGALVALQEYRQLPSEASFVRLVQVDVEGMAREEAFLRSENFECGTRRPVARLSDGEVVALTIKSGNQLQLERVIFQPIGTVPALQIGGRADSGAMLIADEVGPFNELERANGTPATVPIGLGSISRDQILARARAALNVTWHLDPLNFSRPEVANECNPPAKKIWLRPHRLTPLVNKDVKGVPYRWGGYLRSLDNFTERLKQGALAGSVCTCRNTNCIHPLATGLDCSGFVSYAWRTGNYYTTASLPDAHLSLPILWSDLAPGDIVNRRGKHVRLVETIQTSVNGTLITVIESATKKSCGGVCRRTYAQTELQNEKYVPLRRHALEN